MLNDIGDLGMAYVLTGDRVVATMGGAGGRGGKTSAQAGKLRFLCITTLGIISPSLGLLRKHVMACRRLMIGVGQYCRLLDAVISMVISGV